MDLLPAILGAQKYDTAIKQVQATREGMSREDAWKEIGRVVVSMGWALLIAPELYLCLCAWWRVQRLAEDLEAARIVRDRLEAAMQDPEILMVTELSKEDQPTRFAADVLVREIKVGPDVLSVRSSAWARVQAEIVRTEDAQARAETAFERAVQRYQRTLEDVTALSPQAMAARLLTRAWREQDVATCRALLEVATKPEDAAGLLSDEARRSRIDELLAKRAGRV